MSPTPKQMGRRLQALRMEQKMSRQELAAKAGVTREYVRLVEAGRRDLTVGTLQKLAKALGVSAADLMK